MLVFDVSGSMRGRPFRDAKAAAIYFIGSFDMAQTQFGVVSFAEEARLEIPLSHDIAALEATIDAMDLDSNTNIALGIAMAHQELASERHQAASDAVMIVLSDGEGDEPASETRQAADAAKAAGIRIVTIRLGGGVDAGLLGEIASPGDAYAAPSSADLQAIYMQIAEPLLACRSANEVPTPTASPSAPTPTATPVASAPCVADTSISASAPDKTYGDDRAMKASGRDPERWALLRCQAPATPGRRVLLRLYVLEAAEGVCMLDVADTWDERTTWRTRPQDGAAIQALEVPQEDAWVEVDVTEAIGADGVLSIAIRTDSAHDIELATREREGYGPYLVVE